MTTKKKLINGLYIDWKEHPTVEQLRAILKPMGVYVYESDMASGSDTSGFVFSTTPLTAAQVKAYEKEEFGL